MTEYRPATTEQEMRRQARGIGDAVLNWFDLELDLAAVPASTLAAEIRIVKGTLASVADVNASPRLVRRIQRRKNAQPKGNILIYLMGRGGCSFQSSEGGQFTAASGSVVVGSQGAACRVTAAEAHAWKLQMISIPATMLATAAPRIRDGGFQLLPQAGALHGMLAGFIGRLCHDFSRLDAPSEAASLKVLDQLLCASMQQPDLPAAAVATASHQRYLAALVYIRLHLHNPELAPQEIAKNLRISPRQLDRVFDAEGCSVSAQIRSERLHKAADLVRLCQWMPITEVAFGCGFNSMATFYRAFKSEFGRTATGTRNLIDAVSP